MENCVWLLVQKKTWSNNNNEVSSVISAPKPTFGIRVSSTSFAVIFCASSISTDGGLEHGFGSMQVVTAKQTQRV